MKKHVLIWIIILLLGISPVMAQEDTEEASASPTVATEEDGEVKEQQIEDLKERLATKVAELRQVQRRAIFGFMKTLSISSITIETTGKDIKLEVTDDITVAQTISGTRTDLSVEDLDEEDFVVIFGEYDESLDILDAKHIYIQDQPPIHASGSVVDTDDTAFTITIQTPEEREIVIDYERSTDTRLWIGGNGFEDGGFSDIEPGSTIHVIGTVDDAEDNRMSAERIIHIEDPYNYATPEPTPTEAEDPPTDTEDAVEE